MKTNLDTKGWEQRWNKFLDRIVADKGRSQTFISSKHSIEMTDFIRQLLSSQLSELTEEIGKMKRGTHNYTNSHDAIMNGDKDHGYNQALREILSYLKGGER